MMADSLHFEIVTPDGVIFEDQVDEISLPTSEGQITILPHHIPLYSKLSEGEAKIKKHGKETIVAILGGVVEVGENNVSILSDYAIHAESIVMAHAEEAKKRAEEALREKKSEADIFLSDRDLRRSILELKVGQRVKKGTTP